MTLAPQIFAIQNSWLLKELEFLDADFISMVPLHYFDFAPEYVIRPAHQRLGLAMVPEGQEVFARMSAEENLMAGAYPRRDHDTVGEPLDHADQPVSRQVTMG